MAMTKQVKRLYEFGPFRLDVTERVLRKNGKEIGLTLKNFEVLLVLIENNGHIVEREVLMQKCWPDSFVEEANITQNISVLRQKLNDEGDNHKYIETIPKRGYRFTATVKEVVEEVESVTPINSALFPAEKDLAPTYSDVGQADSRRQCVLVISARIDEIDMPIAEAIEAHLRKVSKDVTLTLVRIEPGSVKLILEGTRDGFERINELIESGQLSEILGFDIKELRWGLSSEKAKTEPQHRDRSYPEDTSPRKGTWFPTQLALALNQPSIDDQSAFNNLLLLLDADQEQAAIRYERIHQKLITLFKSRGVEFPEDLADETMERVVRKIQQGKGIIPPLENYFYGVARNVYLEFIKGRPSSPALQMPGMEKAEVDERNFECLEKCLLSLPDDQRELILTYYEGAGKSKIVNRKNLAVQLGIPINSLRIRVHRIRAKLEKCISDCIKRASQDI